MRNPGSCGNTSVQSCQPWKLFCWCFSGSCIPVGLRTTWFMRLHMASWLRESPTIRMLLPCPTLLQSYPCSTCFAKPCSIYWASIAKLWRSVHGFTYLQKSSRLKGVSGQLSFVFQYHFSSSRTCTGHGQVHLPSACIGVCPHNVVGLLPAHCPVLRFSPSFVTGIGFIISCNVGWNVSRSCIVCPSS